MTYPQLWSGLLAAYGGNVDPAEAIGQIRSLATGVDLFEASEATTRLVVIDRVLIDVLGWPATQLNPETPHESGKGSNDWLDYELTFGTAKVVVEAKRSGKTFHFSKDRRQETYRLDRLRRNHGPELKEAIAQTLGYCGTAQTPFFIVTNGMQWIIGLAHWPGVQPDILSALVYHDLQQIEENLQEFIDFASPHAFESHALVTKLLQAEEHAPPFADSLNARLYNNGPTDRNYLSAPIAVIMREYFGRLGDNRENDDFYERCYVTSELAEGYVKRLSLYTGNTKPDGLRNAAKLDRERLARDTSSHPLRNSGDLVVIAGGMGSGKSEFVHFASRRIRDSSPDWIVLTIDLVGRTELVSSFSGEVMKSQLAIQLLKQAEETYPKNDPFAYANLRGIFSSEIQRELKARPPNSDSEGVISNVIATQRSDSYVHLVSYFKYLRSLGKDVTVFLDNVDRGTAELEHFVFLFGRGLSSDSGVSVVTTMRESTYESGRRQGFLDVGGYTTFTISPPSFASVAKRRFEFAKTAVSNSSSLRTRILRGMEDYPLERVEDFVSVLAELALGKAPEMGRAIQQLAGPNIRQALELLERFATSGNTDIEALLKTYNRGVYNQSVGVFVRSLMRGDKLRYEENTSLVPNLFKVGKTRMSSHFAAIRVLQFLASRLDDNDLDVPVGQVASVVSKVGPTIQGAARAIEYLGKTGLIASRSNPDQPWPVTATVRLAAAGHYYLKEVVFLREYVQNIIDDTILYDSGVLAQIEQIHRGYASWRDKYDDKARVFLRYLIEREHKELGTAVGDRSEQLWCVPIATLVTTKIFGAAEAKALSTAPSSNRKRRNSSRGP